MGKKRKRIRNIIVIGGCIVAAGFVAFCFRTREIRENYRQSEAVFGNPLMGFAPCAWRQEVEADVSLLYVDVTWRELQPYKETFAWESIEEENQFARWKREGKHIVFRFVCDIPGQESHMDIPDWLYEETGGDGDWYDMGYGKGYSPNYGNETLIRYHRQAVEAMGARWGQDSFISYIELGSLGHWGEWHVNYGAGLTRLPKEEIRLSYILPWTEAFPESFLLMRRPFRAAKDYHMGLYNDMAGDKESTEEWMQWIRSGGDFRQAQEKGALVPMKDYWKNAPCGGELTSGIPMEELADKQLFRTAELIRNSHMTFLGPKVVPKEYEKGYKTILSSMGYQLWIRQSAVKPKGGKTILSLVWENTGTAPFYGDWPVYVSLSDERGAILESREIPIKLSKILPGEQMTVKAELSGDVYKRIREKNGSLAVEIRDPMTGRPAVRLKNDTADGQKMDLFRSRG